ncbi:holo-ACP synthase [Pseudoclavibacter alba]|uniref:holo-ACP synthase n=1 Tax=Pseudoclavibacter albus TaxID=272241 RepID=UPI0019D17979|nr:holo-ACP synthase [Pseudoclavibacter alba]
MDTAPANLAGIGVDTVELSRFAAVLDGTPRFLERVFAPGERGLSCRSLAARFAAREAAIKAIGGLDGLTLLDLEVVREPSGAPRFARGERLDAVLASRGIGALHLSLSHDGNQAIAFVVAEWAKS